MDGKWINKSGTYTPGLFEWFVLAVTMFVLWVAFTPSGPVEMTPTESTTWEPVG